MLELSAIVSGALGAAFVTGVFVTIQVFINKKLRSPSDHQAQATNAINERNELMRQYRSDAADAKTEAAAAKAKVEEANARAKETDDKLDDLQDNFNSLREEWLHWGYKAVMAIRRLGGTDEDIPRPTPTGLKI